MGLASHARWARCRAARVSPWARRMNLSAFGSKRWHGIAAAQPAQLLCAEVRPALCFPEQSCGAGSSGTAPGARGEGGADPSEIRLQEDMPDLTLGAAHPGPSTAELAATGEGVASLPRGPARPAEGLGLRAHWAAPALEARRPTAG
ncbi:unnamed protein product [Prorocentrum cordatum]|uniref:Uncharacterized protein n=1 Tax=Prorocentrum cordatum TaxID=2364126 RepID=A0ABN9RQD3_9DINO|nr:unnamed protein product [Polarella glacialis]